MADNTADFYLSRFRQHNVHATLQAILDSLAPVLATSSGFPPDALERAARLQRGVQKAKQLLESADASLVSGQVLEEAKNAANATLQQVNNFKGNKNIAHLNTANDNLDTGVLTPLMRMPRVETPADVSSVFKAVDNERERVQAALRALTEQTESARKTLEGVLSSESGIKDAIRKQEERLNALIAQSDKVVAQFNERSTAAERDRDSKFVAELATLHNSIADRIKNASDQFAGDRQQLQSSATDLLTEMQNYKSQAASLAHVIGEIGAASPFDKMATKDRRAAGWLRLIAGVFFAGMVATVVWTALHLVSVSGSTIGYMVFRYMTALIFAIPGYYFAREAAKFQSEADRNRRLQLELASVGPFIDVLDAQKKATLREELARKYFSGVTVAPEKIEKAVDPNKLVELVSESLKTLRR